MDSLITQTHTNSDISVFHNFATFTAQQLPYMWVPSPNPYEIVAVQNKLHNVKYNALFTIFPEYWNFVK